MEKKIDIRLTTKKDLEQLPWLYRQDFFGDSKIKTNHKHMIEKFNELVKNEDYKFISAVVDDKLVGFCSVVVNHDITEQQKPIMMLWNLRVHPDYRKQGIGRKLVDFVEKIGKEVGAYAVILVCNKENQAAIKFYNKLGFCEEHSFIKNI